MIKNSVLTRSVGIGGVFALVSVASAQTSAQNSSQSIEMVVVTAQRRAENLQKVPIAVQAFTAETAQALGFDSGTELGTFVPGLVVTRGTNVASAIIRGVGSSNNSAGDEAANAFYVDGVYSINLTAGMTSFSNIERIEVLKGPQGTLFGRNSTGGLISITTKTPSHTPSADLSVGYGNFDTTEGTFYGTTGITENLAADLSVYTRDQAEGWGNYVMRPGRPDGLKSRETAARSKWVWTPGDDTSLTFAASYSDADDDTGSFGRNVPGSFLFDGLPGPTDFYDSNDDFPNSHEETVRTGSLTVKHDMSWASVVSISAYQERKAHDTLDADRGATPFVNVPLIDWVDEAWTQELQLLSSDTSTIKWIVGLYGLDSVSKFKNIISGTVAGALPFIALDDQQDSTSYAGFGQVTIPVLQGTRLTAGYRYTVDKRELSGSQFTAGRVLVTVDKDATFKKPTWRVALDHDFGEKIMGFVQASRGFKSGVFNPSAPSDPAVAPEILDAYEIGIKLDGFDDRLRFNSSAFFYKYDDLQVKANIPGGTRIINAAQSEIRGFESEIEAIPVRNLTVRGSVSVLDTEFKDFPGMPVATPRPGGGNLINTENGAGNEMPRAPKYTLTASAEYVLPRQSGAYGVNVHYYYNDGFFWNAENRLRQGPYGLLNASLRWTSPSDRYTVKLWGKNLGDKEYFNYVSGDSGTGDYGNAAAPRTYGVTVGVSFE